MRGFNINRQRKKAERALLRLFSQRPLLNQDPILSLIQAALLDDRGNVTPAPEVQGPDQNQMQLWTRLFLNSPLLLRKAVYLVMRRDQEDFDPRSKASARLWCASLVIEVLSMVER